MLRLKIVLLTLIMTCGQWVLFTPDADAGILRDWFRRWRQPAQQQVPVTAGFAQTQTSGNFAGLQPGQCMKTCQQTCSRTVVNYVPCTSYRTTYARVPVTSYRPQTSSDPCTGCTVTCMRPCTTYTYRTRRVPYTTYRPVYRTQTYRVPVTTITNDCATAAPTCNTCSTGAPAAPAFGQQQFGQQQLGQQQFGAPLQGQTVPGGTLSTQGSFGFQQPVIPGATVTPLPTPADSTPGINPQNSNRSVIEGLGGSSTRVQPPAVNWALTSTQKAKPSRSINRDWSSVPVLDVAEKSPVTRKWAYTAVKQAAYVSLDEQKEDSSVSVYRGSFAPVKDADEAKTQPAKMNAGWKTVQW